MSKETNAAVRRLVFPVLLPLTLLCVYLPILLFLTAGHSLAHPGDLAAIVPAGGVLALLAALAGWGLVRRLSLAPAERRVAALERTCRTLENTARRSEMLLREVHHRIKNDLQILSSTMRLSEDPGVSPSDHRILAESRNRIHAISLLHELLYRRTERDGVSIRCYLTDLVRQIERSLLRGSEVAIVSRVGDYYFDSDTAIACGLLVNELVTNSVKHAFPAGSSGVILVQVVRCEAGRYALEVQDDGVGFPEECSFRDESTLGIRLVRGLSEQLRGRLEVEREEGTKWRVEFRARELSASG